ncbi:hypothetical protein ESCCO14588_3538 [Escherichia coli O157:H7 str. TW14588]|nr:hypothetical protein ESCCO14588_3538 [Escherichia coli O157:H7 str. TW14588]
MLTSFPSALTRFIGTSCSAAYPHDAAVSMAMAAMILHFIKPSLIPLTD